MASAYLATSDSVQLAAVSAGHTSLLPLIGLPEVKKRVNFNEIPRVMYTNYSEVQPCVQEKPVGPFRRFVRRVRKSFGQISKERPPPNDMKPMAPRSPIPSPRMALKRKRTVVLTEDYNANNWDQQDTSQITAELMDIFEQMTLNMNRKKPRLASNACDS